MELAGSNQRLPGCNPRALPAELIDRGARKCRSCRMRKRSSGARAGAGEPQLVSYLRARWTLSSTPARQYVPGKKSDGDDRRRDRDDGDGGGGYDHAAILASRPDRNEAVTVAQLAEIDKLATWLFAIARVASTLGALKVSCGPRLCVQANGWSPQRFAPEVASRSRGGPPCQSRHSAVASSRS
jgi:hypothetical protein